MSKKLDIAGAISLAATFAVALLSADGSSAAVKAQAPGKAPIALLAQATSELPASSDMAQDAAVASEAQDEAAIIAPSPTAESAASLAELVASQTSNAPLSRELNCLASAIYFESKSEPLTGQLAVGRVIVARSRSGRFPESYCGVVYQPSQFSFVRGGGMPSIAKDSRGWHNAVAIARIAHEGTWASPVEGALFFHAARVSPSWRAARMAKVGNHVFYR